MKSEKIWEKLGKEFGEGSLFRASSPTQLKVEVIPTPSPSLNDAIGFGGLPLGRISQFHGPEAAGKTMFAMLMVKQAQELYPESEVVWIDAEYSFSNKWATSLGIDTDRLIVIRENDGAKVFTYLCGKSNDKGKKVKPGILDLIAANELDVKLVVLDSIAQLIPPVEDGRGFDEQEMAALARLLPKGFRVTSSLLSKANCAMLCINQAREKLGARVPTLTYPGGRAYRHSLSLTVQFMASEAKDNILYNSREEKIGHKILAKVEKTRGGPDKHRAEFFLSFNEGVVKKGSEVALLGHAYGVVDRPNAQMWEYKDMSIRGAENFANELEANPDLMNAIIAEVEEMKESGVEKDNSVFEESSNVNIEEFDTPEEK